MERNAFFHVGILSNFASFHVVEDYIFDIHEFYRTSKTLIKQLFKIIAIQNRFWRAIS